MIIVTLISSQDYALFDTRVFETAHFENLTCVAETELFGEVFQPLFSYNVCVRVPLIANANKCRIYA